MFDSTFVENSRFVKADGVSGTAADDSRFPPRKIEQLMGGVPAAPTPAIGGTGSKHSRQGLDTSATTSGDADDLTTVLVSVRRIA
jgi:hypothetical protein